MGLQDGVKSHGFKYPKKFIAFNSAFAPERWAHAQKDWHPCARRRGRERGWSASPAGRTAERLRAEIRARFGFREATISDAEMLTEWLRDHVAGEAGGAGVVARKKVRP